MKTKLLAATALVSASLLSTPSFADTVTPATANAADGTTTAAMASQCEALAAAHGPATGPNDHWTAEVVEGAVTQVGETIEVGNRVIDQSSVIGTGTYVPGALYIQGNPFRTGGSVNLFGDQWSSAGYYPDSTYDFTADFTSTFSHAFSCDISQEVYHEAYVIPGHAVEGYYVVEPTDHGNEEAHQQSCNAFTAQGPAFDHWGEDHAQCDFVKTADAVPDETVDESWDPPVTTNELGTAVTQDQTDTLDGFEDHGGRVDVTAEYKVGQVVICISPGSKGGSWRVQNGYNGGSFTGPTAGCNTPYFKIAPYGSGSQTSNGTFTSVPHYNLP